MSPDPSRDKPGQIVRGTDSTGADRNLRTDTTGALLTGTVGAGLPYGADNIVVTNVAAGPATITYKLGSTTLKTRTISYTNSGASASDVITNIADA